MSAAEGREALADEPLLISAMRRADQQDHVRIRTLGTSIGGFLREYDDWLARVKREAAAEALQQVTDRWTQGGWSNALLPKPTPPAVPVIAYANRVGDWLRDHIEEARDANHA